MVNGGGEIAAQKIIPICTFCWSCLQKEHKIWKYCTWFQLCFAHIRLILYHYLYTLWIYLCAKGRIGICWLTPNSLGIGWHRLAPNRAGTAIHAAWLTVSLKGWRLHQAESPSSLIETVAAFTTQGKSTVIGCKITLGRAIHIELVSFVKIKHQVGNLRPLFTALTEFAWQLSLETVLQYIWNFNSLIVYKNVHGTQACSSSRSRWDEPLT